MTCLSCKVPFTSPNTRTRKWTQLEEILRELDILKPAWNPDLARLPTPRLSPFALQLCTRAPRGKLASTCTSTGSPSPPGPALAPRTASRSSPSLREQPELESTSTASWKTGNGSALSRSEKTPYSTAVHFGHNFAEMAVMGQQSSGGRLIFEFTSHFHFDNICRNSASRLPPPRDGLLRIAESLPGYNPRAHILKHLHSNAAHASSSPDLAEHKISTYFSGSFVWPADEHHGVADTRHGTARPHRHACPRSRPTRHPAEPHAGSSLAARGTHPVGPRGRTGC